VAVISNEAVVALLVLQLEHFPKSFTHSRPAQSMSALCQKRTSNVLFDRLVSAGE
jgi:hypothetical protein